MKVILRIFRTGVPLFVSGWNSYCWLIRIFIVCIVILLQNTALSAALKLNYDLAGNLAAVQAGTSGVPVILAQPFVQIDEDNRNVVSLSVNVVSDTPATCQWQLNGQNIVGATSATLLLQNMTAADSGSYTVVITNATGNVTSTATILSFGLPPNIPVNFEYGLVDWTVDGGTWEVGAPTSGPNAAHSGAKCAATVLGGNYSEPNGNTGRSLNTRLMSPLFIVPDAAQNPRLRFWQWYSFNVGPDYGEVQIKVGAGAWQPLSGDYMQTGGNVWTRASLDLSAYAGQTVQVGFFFHAQDDSSTTPEVAPGWYVDEVTLVTGPVATLTPNVAESFEAGPGDWYVDGGTWETGAPTSGQNAAHSGTKCAATVLAGNYSEPNGDSGQSVNTRLVSPCFTVPAAVQNPRLRFWHWYSFNVGPDYGEVQIKVGSGTWQALSGDYLQTGGNVWTRTSLDLSAYAGQTVQVGFFFHAQDDSSITPEVAPGWYVDEVTLVTGPFAPLTPNVAESFEGGLGDWYVDGGTWETGTPTSGPNAAHSGTKCAATVLAGNYYEPNGSSGQSVNTRLTSPPFTVPVAGQNPRLRFWQWYSFNVGPDYGEVQIRVGTGAWQALSGDYLQTGGNMWTHASLDLSAYAGQIVQIGFFFHAQDDSGTTPEVAPGWYLDEVALVTGAFTTVVYTDSVLAWWPGEGSALDAAGTHHGTLQGGAAYASGKVGQAFSLNGSTSMVQIPDSPDWAFGSADFSIELWANFSVSTGSRAFVASDQGSGNQNKWIFWLDGGVLRFHINGSAGSASIGSAGFVPTLNQWYHLAITRSSSSYTFYVNGSSVSANVDGRSVPNANAPLTIGSAEGAFFFNGRLDEVSIYNRTLSDGEIAAINAAGATGKVFTPGQIWRKSYFGATSNTGVAADTADPDFDGLANLLEFATNSIPTLSSSQPGQAVRNSSNLEFIYTRNKAAMSGGITFAVEWSDTLPGTSWSSTGVTQQVLSDNGTVQQVKATLPVGSAGRRFVHLKVTGP